MEVPSVLGLPHPRAGRLTCPRAGRRHPARAPQVRLQQGRPLEGESDCSAALQLGPSYTKAYLRRAAARQALGKYGWGGVRQGLLGPT